jgi:hypothetical protein
MDLSESSFVHAERRISPRPPVSPRYKRLRREVRAPEELKEVLIKGLKLRVLLVAAVAVVLAASLLA